VAQASPETVLAMPAEVEFVPAAQRSTLHDDTSKSVSQVALAVTKLDPLTGDPIVVVRRRKDKNKKGKQANDLISSTSGSGLGASIPIAASEVDVSKVEMANVEPFDYSSVPNILDEDDHHHRHSQVGQKRSKKSKQKEGAEGDTANKRARGMLLPNDFLYLSWLLLTCPIARASGSAIEYGNFPAPPKNRAEPRSGNISHTFR
jgi:exosome complex exonuclease RRP6